MEIGGIMTRSEIDLIKEEIVKYVINCESGYESEYAGRMESWCFFCGAYHEPKVGITHESNCIWLKAQILKEK
jgi:hypothetical protein